MSKMNLFVVAACLVLASGASASTINLQTGTDGAGTPLAAGATDPNWIISTNGSYYTNATVAYSPDICCGMNTISGPAQWVSDASTTPSSPASDWGVGNTVYLDTTFDLTSYDLSTTSLSGVWRVADETIGLFLNGTQIAGPATNSWSYDSAVSVPTGSNLFVQGLNTLVIEGSSINSEWDGFYFNGSVTGSTTPEPSTLLMLAGGMAAVFGVRRFRRS